MKTLWMAVAVLIGGIELALASPPGRYSDWADGPVRHLMTREDVAQWESLRTEGEAKTFIELFWARRDPDPDTPRNEWRQEFEKRVTLADEHFTTKRTRGAMSDRGRTMILLGAPYNVSNKGPAPRAPANPNFTSADQWDGKVRGPRGEPAMLVWTYSHDRKPQFVKRKDFAIVFVDDQGDGQWQFGPTDRINPEALLEDAARAYIFNPGLTSLAVAEPPPVGTSLGTPSLKTAYDHFRAANKTSEGPAVLTWGEFVTPDGESFVPVQLFVPARAGIESRTLTFFEVVENASGEIVQAQERAVELATSRGDSYIDTSLRLAPGKYTLTAGLAADGKPLAISRTELTVAGLDPVSTGISPLILSNNIYPLPEFPGPTDPFTFGGLKVVPKGDAVFDKKDELWYFAELRNPGINDAGDPAIRVKIEIEGKAGTRKLRMPFPLQDAPIAKLKGVENRYAVGTGIPLETFPPGDYTIKIQLIDSVLDRKYDFERKFQIRDSG